MLIATFPVSEVRELLAYYEILSENDVEAKLRRDGSRMREKYQETE